MSEAKFTKGPWYVEVCEYEDRIRAKAAGSDGELSICNLPHWREHFRVEQKANAHLIAAAPELLRACSLILTRLDAEAADQGKDAVFLGAALRDTLRAAIAQTKA